jgi:hypothetical protein
MRLYQIYGCFALGIAAKMPRSPVGQVALQRIARPAGERPKIINRYGLTRHFYRQTRRQSGITKHQLDIGFQARTTCGFFNF